MRLVPILLLLMAACNAPGPHFRGLSAVQVDVDGSTFDVRVRGNVGEAIRTNVQYAPRLGPIAGRARIAIEHVSGCRVREMRGDQAQATGLLTCNGPSRPQQAWTYREGDQECLVTEEFVRPSTGETVLELDCTPIR